MNFREQLAAIRNGDSPKTTGAKPKKPIAKVSAKKRAEVEADKAARNGGDTDLVKWFKAQMRMMPEQCEQTGLRLETRIYEYAIMSICHILPKASCKSVALHPLNRMFFNPDFHTKFDAMSWEEREQLGCWPVIRQRLISVWEDLHPNERRHFPPKLRDWIEQNDVFANYKVEK